MAVINQALFIAGALVFAYFLLTIFLGVAKIAGAGQHIKSLESKGASADGSADLPGASVYTPADPALGNRNVFQPAGTVTSSADTGASSAAAAYKVVGVSESSDASETYVMVENTKTKLTYFLQYGQPVEGLELERIVDDKVIVKIGGKSVELE